jgi:DNA polymerase-3 subunit delta
MADIHFLYGNDEYGIARQVQELAKLFHDPTEAEMNTERLDARTMSEAQWVNAVNALPFLAKQRLVVLDNPSARFAGRKAKPDKAAEAKADGGKSASAKPAEESAAERRKKFLESLTNLPGTTRLVITEIVELRSKADRMAAEKHWLAVWLRKNGHKVSFVAQPEAGVMTGWILNEARTQGGVIGGEAASRLSEMVGTDTRQAAQEVTKLLTYVNWGRPVTIDDVDALSPLTAAPDMFKMVDALADGKTRDAQRLLHRMLEFQDEFSTWGMIIRQFRYLLIAREVLDRRGGEDQAVEALSEVEGRQVHSFVAAKALNQARRFTMQSLEALYHRLLEIDEDAKNGRMPLDVALELLVVEAGK